MKYIDTDIAPEELSTLLNDKGWIQNESVQSVSRPGEGNMNVVLRVHTEQRSFILKQSRPYVNKYQDIPAPLGRIDTEFQFYNCVGSLDDRLPKIYNYDPQEYLLMMEDLGDTEDLTSIYNGDPLGEQDLHVLIDIVRSIHQQDPPTGFPLNLELRRLNHQHIFVLPFIQDNGFDLDSVQPGLAALALPILADNRLIDIVTRTGEQYLAKGTHLIHGDYYPGSWMQQDGRIYVLDPEFCFVGFKEFDVGVMAAHMILSTHGKEILSHIVEYYKHPMDNELVSRIAGIEIMRRLIGLAQLPLERTISEKEELLELARQLVVQ